MNRTKFLLTAICALTMTATTAMATNTITGKFSIDKPAKGATWDDKITATPHVETCVAGVQVTKNFDSSTGKGAAIYTATTDAGAAFTSCNTADSYFTIHFHNSVNTDDVGYVKFGSSSVMSGAWGLQECKSYQGYTIICDAVKGSKTDVQSSNIKLSHP